MASANGSNVNFFDNSTIPDDTYYEVNGVRQESAINSLTFSAGDTVKIIYGLNKFSSFSCEDKNYLQSITGGRVPTNTSNDFYYCFRRCYNLTSIPEGLFDNNPNVIEFRGSFEDCSNLTSIPEGLFDNNPHVTAFAYCFRRCSNLTSIPEGLFDNNPNVTVFSYCFDGCSNLTSIPVDLFDKNTAVNNFRSCFDGCSNLTVVVQIGSTASRVFADYFAQETKAKGTVYCRAGSVAYEEFSSTSSANVNVLTY